jgi:5-methylcytosine-specific restriction protein B
MSVELLSDLQIKDLYAQFRAESPWPEWFESYKEELLYFQSLSDDGFVQPNNQERLWCARGVSGIGPGESVNVSGAYTDRKVIDYISKLRRQDWPDDLGKRAGAIQEAYDTLINLVHPTHAKTRPMAKLARLITVLIPEHMYTAYNHATRKAVAQLINGTLSHGLCEAMVYGREKLRKILGKEDDLDEHVLRSMFCWWLFENEKEIHAGSETVRKPASPDNEEIKLEIWPYSKQLKGIAAIKGYKEGYREVVNAARGGGTPEDIVESMQTCPVFEGYKPNSCRNVFNSVRRMGFIENKDGLWWPSKLGEELMEEDPPGILTKTILEQVYPFAHLLRHLREKSDTKQEMVNYLRSLYPAWSNNWGPSALLSWGLDLDLIEYTAQSGEVRLTDFGIYWERCLPEELPKAPPPPDIGTEMDDPGREPYPSGDTPVPPDFASILNRFVIDRQLSKFVFTEEQLSSLHLAWHSHTMKRFVIISGLSGTGKTALLKHYSRTYCELMGLGVEKHLTIVPVSPDWRDPSGILGYFNALHADPTFQAEPALRLVIRAARNPDLPYFLILDEMNLARVEKYFAPFLSAMETGDSLQLHAHDEDVNDVPPSIPWPPNLFIGGTVNMDETTYPFSDKVLDRAFTLEFWDVDLARYFSRRSEADGRDELAENLLLKLNKILAPVRRHFGYRTADAVLSFLNQAKAHSTAYAQDEAKYLDQVIFAKVLPRLRGEESPEMEEALTNLEKLFNEHDLKQCSRKTSDLRNQLARTGVMKFWA